jgi:hypothetical protein
MGVCDRAVIYLAAAVQPRREGVDLARDAAAHRLELRGREDLAAGR